MRVSSMFNSLWSWLCSLKVAIVLASLATSTLIAGSLIMPGHMDLFGSMDQMPLHQWWSSVGRQAPHLTRWIWATGLLLALLGLNTLCCFIDWLQRIRSRWRKTGEYLLHIGFVLVLCGYFWGSSSGYREKMRLAVGETAGVVGRSGVFLRLDDFNTLDDANGRPIDMLNSLTLLVGDQAVRQKAVHTNHPLTYGGLAILPLSFGSDLAGFRFFTGEDGEIELTERSVLPLPNGGSLRVLQVAPMVIRDRSGAVRPSFGTRPANPALELEILYENASVWRGWYVLQESPPFPLIQAGIRLWPTGPIYRNYSLLAVHYDPGAPLAAAGGVMMLTGVLIAVCSYYGKRRLGDRPEIT